jgi:hypothetical protein
VPTWVGGVNQDSGKWQRSRPKHRQATDGCPAPPGEIRTSFGVQALPGTVATCIGPPQPNASAVNGLSTAEHLPVSPVHRQSLPSHCLGLRDYREEFEAAGGAEAPARILNSGRGSGCMGVTQYAELGLPQATPSHPMIRLSNCLLRILMGITPS